MENVKFVRSEKGNYDSVVLYFKLCDNLADFLRRYTGFKKKENSSCLSDDNIYYYCIAAGDDFEEIKDELIETIEKICNEKNDAYLYNHLLTDFGHRRKPWEIHRIMHEEYGLADIEESENNNSKDKDIEWWTALFFISFGRKIFFDNIKEDIQGGDDITNATLTESEVSELLSAIKSIDKIVVVDDVRKYGPEDIKKMLEEMDANKDKSSSN